MTTETNSTNQANPNDASLPIDGEYGAREFGDIDELRKSTVEHGLATADEFLADGTTHVEVEIPLVNKGYDTLKDEEGEPVQIPVERTKEGKLKIVRNHPKLTAAVATAALGTVLAVRYIAKNNKK